MTIHLLNRTLCLAAAALLLAGASTGSVAGEVAVDPADNGIDVRDDRTEDEDSRSSEVAAAVEEFVEAVPNHPHDVPLAEAVTSAEGLPEPLRLLGAEIPVAVTRIEVPAFRSRAFSAMRRILASRPTRSRSDQSNHRTSCDSSLVRGGWCDPAIIKNRMS